MSYNIIPHDQIDDFIIFMDYPIQVYLDTQAILETYDNIKRRPFYVTEIQNTASIDWNLLNCFCSPSLLSVNVSIFDTDHNLFYELGFETINNQGLDKAMRDVDTNAPYDGLTYVKTIRSYDTIALGRKIYAVNDSSIQIGYAFVFISDDLFSENILSNVDLGTGSKLMIIGRDGTVLSANDKELPLGTPYIDPELIKQIKE